MMYSQRNLVVVALLQVGVLVMGRLGLGAVERVFMERQMPLTSAFMMMRGLTWILFLVPLGWTMAGVYGRQYLRDGEEFGDLWLWFGMVILVGLTGAELWAGLSPFVMNCTWGSIEPGE